jgi:hypothetical protein
MSAERTTLASATTAGGSEILEHLLLAYTPRLKLRADLFGKPLEHLPANVDREVRVVPRQEESRRGSVACHQDHLVGTEHLARAIAEVSDRDNLHVTTSVVTRYQTVACADEPQEALTTAETA